MAYLDVFTVCCTLVALAGFVAWRRAKTKARLDAFACAALTGLLARRREGGIDDGYAVADAWDWADAMEAERTKRLR